MRKIQHLLVTLLPLKLIGDFDLGFLSLFDEVTVVALGVYQSCRVKTYLFG